MRCVKYSRVRQQRVLPASTSRFFLVMSTASIISARDSCRQNLFRQRYELHDKPFARLLGFVFQDECTKRVHLGAQNLFIVPAQTAPGEYLLSFDSYDDSGILAFVLRPTTSATLDRRPLKIIGIARPCDKISNSRSRATSYDSLETTAVMSYSTCTQGPRQNGGRIVLWVEPS